MTLWHYLQWILPNWFYFRCSCPEVFCKKDVLENLVKFTRKRLCKVAGLRPPTLLKERLWHGVFSVNFAKFLRKPFL